MLGDVDIKLARIILPGIVSKVGRPVDVIIDSITADYEELLVAVGNSHKIVHINECSWVRGFVPIRYSHQVKDIIGHCSQSAIGLGVNIIRPIVHPANKTSTCIW